MAGLTLLVCIFAISISSMDLALAIVWGRRVQLKWSKFLIVFVSTLLGVVFSYSLMQFSLLLGETTFSLVLLLVWKTIFILDVTFLIFFIPRFINWVVARPFQTWEKVFFVLLCILFATASALDMFLHNDVFVIAAYAFFTVVLVYTVIIMISIRRNIEEKNVRHATLTIMIVSLAMLPLFISSMITATVRSLFLPLIALCYFIMLLVFLFIALANSEHKMQMLSETADGEKKAELAEKIAERFHITDREMEIVRLIKIGLTNKEIAARLNISVNTVNNHIANIFGKTNVRCRIDLLNLFEEASW